MRQALHIFRKDVRRCWPQIAIVLGLTAVVTAQLGREPLSDAFTSLSTGLYPLMVLSWFYLIPVVVHAESSIGHRQFWLTRPYSWKSLLTAKLLLIVVCINLSALVSDVVILLAQGLSPHEGAANLFWRQMFLIYVFVLPSLALATVTRNLAQFAGIALGLIVGVTLTWEYCRVHNRGWGTLNWVIAAIACAVVIAGTAVAVLCQYARSGLLKSSCVLAATMTLWSGIVWANANVKPERGTNSATRTGMPKFVWRSRPTVCIAPAGPIWKTPARSISPSCSRVCRRARWRRCSKCLRKSFGTPLREYSSA